MVRESGCTAATMQVRDAGARYGLGICLEGLTAAEVSRLYALLVRWRHGAAQGSCTRIAGPSPCAAGTCPDLPLVSIGPSGVGGPYQTEF
ncbi:MAG: hypothetical protein KBE04_02335 [Phycisphaerae bacterium]|nr:hypothetical protein [Phycisphaerae bacterium]